MGTPLVGTSWLNRPYYLGVDLGTVWEMDRVQSDVSRDTDMYGGIYGGWDWDYYWGTELSIQRRRLSSSTNMCRMPLAAIA